MTRLASILAIAAAVTPRLGGRLDLGRRLDEEVRLVSAARALRY